MNGVDRPEHWPLNPSHLDTINNGLAACDAADELLAKIRQVGLPAPAAEESCQHNRAILNGAKQTFFPGQI